MNSKAALVGVFRAQRRGFSSWHGLGAFVPAESREQWAKLLRAEGKVKAVEDAVAVGRATGEGGVDWHRWEKSIRRKSLVQCLKKHYEAQTRVLDSLAAKSAAPSASASSSLATESWALFDRAVASCAKSVEASQGLLEGAASALWLSFHNPPVWRVDSNEWLSSDRYWHAFVEKHFFYATAQPATEDPESPAKIEASKAALHSRIEKFNARSDTPVLFNFMDSLPSWEYYDIHRRAFFERAVYFLVRKGTDIRFFPEDFPWQWKGDLEDRRFDILSVAQRRRAALQTSTLAREAALDFLPLDVDHDGFTATMEFLRDEQEVLLASVSRLMGDYAFLCDPFVPCASAREAVEVMELHGADGQWFSLSPLEGEARFLFYLPKNAASRTPPSPVSALERVMNHLTMTGRRFVPTYAALLKVFADVLETRGKDSWFGSRGECASQAFLRRLRSDDPLRSVFEKYFEEMYERFAAAEVISPQELPHRLAEVETRNEQAHLEQQALVALLANSAFFSAKSKAEADALTRQEKEHPSLQRLIDGGAVKAFAGTAPVKDAQRVLESFGQFEIASENFASALKSAKAAV